MSFSRGTRKLLLMGGLTCGGVATALFSSGLNHRFKARAANVTQNQFNDHFQNGSVSSSTKWDSNWDQRETNSSVKPTEGSLRVSEKNKYNDKLEKGKSVAVRHLILIRHGQYDNRGESDSLHILTPLGREQANHVGLKLKDLALPYNRIIHSTLTRATQTADIISQHLPHIPVQSCDFLIEGAPIEPDPEPLANEWKPLPEWVYKDGPRIESAFRQYFYRADPTQTEDSYEILVCHANVIRYFVCRALQFPPEASLRFVLYKCTLTWISIEPNGRVKVLTVGDIGHIPSKKITID